MPQKKIHRITYRKCRTFAIGYRSELTRLAVRLSAAGNSGPGMQAYAIQAVCPARGTRKVPPRRPLYFRWNSDDVNLYGIAVRGLERPRSKFHEGTFSSESALHVYESIFSFDMPWLSSMRRISRCPKAAAGEA